MVKRRPSILQDPAAGEVIKASFARSTVKRRSNSPRTAALFSLAIPFEDHLLPIGWIGAIDLDRNSPP